MVTPKEVVNIDTLLFCKLLNIDKVTFEDNMAKAKQYSHYRPSPFMKQISVSTYATFQEYLFNFSGFYANRRTIRNYPHTIAAQFLGYTQEVNDRDIARFDGYYRAGDYIGASGIERAYEEYLRGNRGIKNELVDVFSRTQGSFMDGKYDTLAISGQSLTST